MKPEEAIRDLCTTNGVLNAPALKAGMEMLRLLTARVPPRDEEPTQPTPTQSAPEMIQ
jgi:hypothetical protein